MRNQSGRRLPNYAVGLIMVAILAIGSYVAFTKNVPWGGGTEFKAVFNSAQNLRPNSPVRIAGVEVGKVKSVEALGGNVEPDPELGEAGTVQSGAVVTMEINDDGLPLKEDATFKLRPRLFLEGNLFVDLRPGSPAAPEVDSDFTFPPQQTSNSVQLDEVLTGALQTDARKDLQIFLDQFGTALVDEQGAQSLKALNEVSPDAFKNTSLVNQAVLGENPHDLSELIANLDHVVRGLDANEEGLKSLITNLRVATGSFAAQDVALEQALQELPNTLDAGQNAFASLNASFPPTRAFSREALPGTRSTPAALEAATPLLRQLRGLASRAELRGLVADLRTTVPNLARLTHRTIPFLRQARTLASCFNHTILPWADDRIDSTNQEYLMEHDAKGTVYEETGYGLAGISGESRSGDANGEYVRVIGGGGTNTVQSVDLNGETTGVGISPLPIEGAMPAIEDSAKTPFRPEAPCENQDPPNLVATGEGPPPQSESQMTTASAPLSAEAQQTVDLVREAAAAVKEDPDSPATKELTRAASKRLQGIQEGFGN